MCTTPIRINHFLAENAQMSRREADRLVADGQVFVNGLPAVPGQKVIPESDQVICRGKKVQLRKPGSYVYLALNKPRGITSTTDSKRRDNIIDYVNYPERLFMVGRLDRDSEGLILLTNDGSIVNRILRAGNRHEKEYLVTLDRPYDPTFLKRMATGVPILDQVTLPAKVRPVSDRTFRITLIQGLNRQIRRMTEALGYEVKRLTRIRIMNISLGSLKTGEWRYLTVPELRELHKLLEPSTSEPAPLPTLEPLD